MKKENGFVNFENAYVYNEGVLVNLTPHEITIVLDGREVKIKPEGTVPRVEASAIAVDHFGEIPVYKTTYWGLEGLPPMTKNVKYIVSALVQKAANFREDLVIPAQQIRDEQGRVIGCKGVTY